MSLNQQQTDFRNGRAATLALFVMEELGGQSLKSHFGMKVTQSLAIFNQLPRGLVPQFPEEE